MKESLHERPSSGRLIAGELASYWGWAAIIAIAIFWRLQSLHSTSFDFDECFELNHLSLSALEVVREDDRFPPLYRWLLSHFCVAFGEGAARAFSVICGLLAVATCGWLARSIVSATAVSMDAGAAGLRAALFAAVSPHQIVFSQQARAYSLYVLVAGLFLWAAWNLVRKQNLGSWLLFLVTGWLGFATHYFFSLLIIQAWLWVGFRLGFRQIHSLLLAGTANTLICLPLLFCLAIDLKNPMPPESVNRVDLTGLLYAGFTLVSGWTLGPSSIALQSLPLRQTLPPLVPWVLAALICLSAVTYRASVTFSLRRVAPLLWLLIASPLLAASIAVLIDSSFSSRYIAWLAVPLAVMFGLGGRFTGFHLTSVASWGLIGLSLVANWNRINDPHYASDNVFVLDDWLATNHPDTTILVMSHYYAESIQRGLIDAEARQLNQSSVGTSSRRNLVIPIAIKADEPDDWREKLWLLRDDLSERGSDRFLIVVRWIRASDPFQARRNELLGPLQAEPLTVLSNNIEVLEGRADALRQWLDTQYPRAELP